MQFTIWPVVFATVFYYFMGFIWFSPFLFGDKWIELTKLGVRKRKPEVKIILSTLVNAFFTVLMIGVVATLLRNHDPKTIVLVSLGMFICVAASVLTHYLYEKKSLLLYLINVGYNLMGMVVSALIIAYWP